MIIHYHPHLCFINLKEGEEILASTDINKVTCKFCVYYYFKPEARNLEITLMMKNQNEKLNES